jgi:hypothetical protein
MKRYEIHHPTHYYVPQPQMTPVPLSKKVVNHYNPVSMLKTPRRN